MYISMVRKIKFVYLKICLPTVSSFIIYPVGIVKPSRVKIMLLRKCIIRNEVSSRMMKSFYSREKSK